MEKECLFAVVVTHQPDHARLERVLEAVRDSVKGVVLVDNGSTQINESNLLRSCPSLVVKRMGTNIGIAAAQNQGITIVVRLGASHVLFLDQDSVPQQGMVSCLRWALARLTDSGLRVACVAPRLRAPASQELSKFRRLGWLRLRTKNCADDKT